MQRTLRNKGMWNIMVTDHPEFIKKSLEIQDLIRVGFREKKDIITLSRQIEHFS